MSQKLTSGERLAVIETEIKGLKSDVIEIKNMLKEHVDWEFDKYDKLRSETAGKWVETVVVGVIITVTSAIIGAVIYLV